MIAGPGPLGESLRELLDEAGCQALVVIADSARDPDIAPFVGPAHLHTCFLLASGDGGRPGSATSRRWRARKRAPPACAC